MVVLDGSVERLELTRQQALGAGLDNLTFARVSDPLHLPLESGSVDLVVVPGLAEWFDAVGKDRPLPPTYGGDLLGELRRVIAPNGQVYLGTEPALASQPGRYARRFRMPVLKAASSSPRFRSGTSSTRSSTSDGPTA